MFMSNFPICSYCTWSIDFNWAALDVRSAMSSNPEILDSIKLNSLPSNGLPWDTVFFVAYLLTFSAPS